MADLVRTPNPIFADVDGNPVEDGYIYVGEAGLDPKTNPVNLFWDEALTVPAAQPVRTKGGMPDNSGAFGRLYLDEDNYSLVVDDKRQDNVFTNLYAGYPGGGAGAGTILEILAGETMALGDPFYIASDGKAYKASNDTTYAARYSFNF